MPGRHRRLGSAAARRVAVGAVAAVAVGVLSLGRSRDRSFCGRPRRADAFVASAVAVAKSVKALDEFKVARRVAGRQPSEPDDVLDVFGGPLFDAALSDGVEDDDDAARCLALEALGAVCGRSLFPLKRAHGLRCFLALSQALRAPTATAASAEVVALTLTLKQALRRSRRSRRRIRPQIRQ